jgi:long-chain acyl-CoA synthetase
VQPSRAASWADENQVKFSSIAELCSNLVFRKAVLQDLIAHGNEAKLSKVELLQDIRLHADEWTPENGMLTAAMKVQRHAINKKYASGLVEMYKQ